VADEVNLYDRATRLMQWLASAYAQAQTPAGPKRGIISREEANEAVMQLFAVIDSAFNAGALPANLHAHGMLMLAAVREYVLPFPEPGGDEELFRQDLVEIAASIDQARSDAGFPPLRPTDDD
jgi:hypothetical protein